MFFNLTEENCVKNQICLKKNDNNNLWSVRDMRAVTTLSVVAIFAAERFPKRRKGIENEKEKNPKRN